MQQSSPDMLAVDPNIPLIFYDESHISESEPALNLKPFKPARLNPNDLTEEYAAITQLLDMCRILQRAIFDKSQEPIFQPPIGFVFEDQPATNQLHDFLVPKFTKTKLPSLSTVKYSVESYFEDSIREEHDEMPIEFNHEVVMEKLKNYVESKKRGVSIEDKILFVRLRNKVQELERFITEQFRRKDNDDHKCKLCGMEFPTGRQLGGHISRTHPGKTHNYVIKKEAHKVRSIEKRRRDHFKTKMITR